MTTLLQRLAERAANGGGSRLRSVAAEVMKAAAGAAHPLEVEEEAVAPTLQRRVSRERTSPVAATPPPQEALQPPGRASPPVTGREERPAIASIADVRPAEPPSRRAPIATEPPASMRTREPQLLMPMSEPSPWRRGAERATVRPDRDAASRTGDDGRATTSATAPSATRVAASNSAPEVHIHIGRVEVRPAPGSPPARRASAPRAAPSLDEYLARRGDGR
jgi:hypothetical protein